LPPLTGSSGTIATFGKGQESGSGIRLGLPRATQRRGARRNLIGSNAFRKRVPSTPCRENACQARSTSYELSPDVSSPGLFSLAKEKSLLAVVREQATPHPVVIRWPRAALAPQKPPTAKGHQAPGLVLCPGPRYCHGLPQALSRLALRRRLSGPCAQHLRPVASLSIGDALPFADCRYRTAAALPLADCW
jgi:hypothetical protein